GELLHVGRIVPIYRLTAGLTAARLRIAMRDALDRAAIHYEHYLTRARPRGHSLRGVPAWRAPERGVAGRDRARARGRPLPLDVRGARCRPASARIRRAARPPAGHGRAAPPARPGFGTADRDRR